MRYTNAQITKVVKYIIENAETLNNALDDALRVTEIEQQNKRYREAIEEAIEKLTWNSVESEKILLKALEELKNEQRTVGRNRKTTK